MQKRYDEEKGIYRDCKFCGGLGCLACPVEAERAFQKSPSEPIATFKIDEPKELIRMKKAIGKDALDRAFGSGGGGVSEIIKNCKEI